MGVVYRATQLALGRPVALKLIAAELRGRRRLPRALPARVAARRLDRPPQRRSRSTRRARPTAHLFIAMRYVEGADLAYLLARRAPLDAERAVRIIGQVAAALDAAHARGLVHRDVKPANVLIGGRGRHVYLTDFGLSKRAAARAGMTTHRPVRRHADYAAPEQIRGEAHGRPHRRLRARLRALPGAHRRASRSTARRDVAKMYAHITEPPPVVTRAAPRRPRRLDAVVAHGDGEGARGALRVRGRPRRARPWRRSPGERSRPLRRAGTRRRPATAPAQPSRVPDDAGTGGVLRRPAPSPAAAGRRLAARRRSPRLRRAAGPAPAGRGRRRIALLLALAVGAAWPPARSRRSAPCGAAGGEDEPRAGRAAPPRPRPPRRRPASRKAVATIEVGEGPDGVAVCDGRRVRRQPAATGRCRRSTRRPTSPPASRSTAGTRPGRRRRRQGRRVGRRRRLGRPSRASRRKASPSATAKVEVGDRPEAISLGKQLVWVANFNDDTVNRIDRATPALVGGPIGVGNEPAGIFVGRRFVWVTNSDDGTVNRIDPSTAQVVGDADRASATGRAA